MKIIKPFFLFVLIYCSFIVNAQNYHRYYELTDSAFYFWKVSENIKADSMYQLAFDTFIGFPDDYANAAYNIWHKNPVKGKEYIAKSFLYGGFIQDIEFYLEKNDISISKRELKKLARQNKEDIVSRKKKRKIQKMLMKDQMARFIFHKKMHIVDSINQLKLIDYTINDSLFFNRFHIGYKASMYSQLLLTHQVWTGITPIQDNLIRYIEKGWLHRDFLWYAIERVAVYASKMYTIRNGKIIIDESTINTQISKKIGSYSMLGQISFWSNTQKQQVVVPVNPQKTEQEINALRHAVFLPPLDIYRKSSGKLHPDVNEFKKIFNL